ncbi:hypothetical protein FRB94_005418 [Tulasnella sp. JGI-2019a]|nr:hypothetical protein FRB94_005418 [Tulasnella sp. JGI-2019a]
MAALELGREIGAQEPWMFKRIAKPIGVVSPYEYLVVNGVTCPHTYLPSSVPSTTHQKVALEIDFSGAIRGYTELTVVPKIRELKSIHLHCRQCEVTKVTVASQLADYVHYDPLAQVTVANPTDVHVYPEIKRKIYSALSDGDEGELSIGMPAEVIARLNAAKDQMIDALTPGASSFASSAIEAIPLVVRIEYMLQDPADGLEFVVPSELYPYRVPHMYTTPSSPDAARCWVPCVDNLWERCTWDLQFVVPRFLDGRSEGEGSDSTAEEGNYPTVVVASGELVEQVSHPYNSSKTIFVFHQPVLTSVQHVAFAAGPFHVLELPSDQQAEQFDNDEEASTQPDMHAFCLPGLEPKLATTTSFYRSAMKFYSTLGSYPFGSHKVVFVDELPTKRFDTSTMSIISNDLLFGEDAIEQVFETRHSLAHSLACQWVGINIIPKTWSDLWLVNGIGLYIAGLFFRQMFGNNEYRFRLKKDMDRIVSLDAGTQPPICQPSHIEPPDVASLSFINLKAPVVLYILDRHLGKSGTSHGLSRVIPKIFLSAISDNANILSTSSFLRTCRKISGVDSRTFAEQWIYSSGCPHFTFNANFNRKKLVVEFMMRQVCPAYEANKHNPAAMTLLKPVAFFEGTITVRIHEADGTPYEHVLDIRSAQKHYEVMFNTKYKRVRRNTKRYASRKAAAQAAAAGDQEAAEDIGLLDDIFGNSLWDDEAERVKWKVADWTEEDEQRMSGATYEWIRMDADFEWIGDIVFDQPDFMWVSQLQRDRDVIAQLQALHALANQPSNITSSFLTHTVLIPQYFYRVRMEAAMLLIRCAIPELDHIGIFHLLKIFTTWCFPPPGRKHEFNQRFIPRPNDFSNIPDYFVRKCIIATLGQWAYSSVWDYSVPRFLIDQLKYNDNTTNKFSDGLYISTIIAALGSSLLSMLGPVRANEQSQLVQRAQAPAENSLAAALLSEAASEVDRYREMDRLVPSMHNVMSIAALEWSLMLMMGNMIPNDGNIFLKYTREGNYTGVRIAAFDGLLLMKWYTSRTLIRYVMTIIANDSSRVIRRHVARGLCESLGILFVIGDIPWVGARQDVLIEDDGATPLAERKTPQRKELDAMSKSVRQAVGRALSLRECIMPIVLASHTDAQVRMCMLKLCELIYRPTDEVLPTLKITLPPTPVTEAPPQPPSPAPSAIKIKAINRKVSILSPNPPSPGPSSPFLPKLKLSTSKLADIRSPVSANSNAFPDAQLMPPPPVPNHVVESLPMKVISLKKKVKQPPKSQSSGMQLADLKICRNVLKKLQGYKRSAIFLQPVDPIMEGLTTYFDIVKNPMDLSTMAAKLEAGAYPDRFAFEADFQLMINNAKLFNPPVSLAHGHAVALEDFFKKQWAKNTQALEAAINTTRNTASAVVETPDDMANAALALEAETSAPETTGLDAVDALTALAEPTPQPEPPRPPTKSLKLNLSHARSTPQATARASPPVHNGTSPIPFASTSSSSATPTPKAKPPKQPKPSRPSISISKPVTAFVPNAPAPSTPAPKAPTPKAPALKAAAAIPKATVPATAPKAPAPFEEDILFAELDMIEAEKTQTPSPIKKSRAPQPPPREPIAFDDLLGEPVEKPKKERGEKRKFKEAAPAPPPQSATPLALNLASSSAPPLSRKASGTPVPSLKLKVKTKESTPVASSSSSSSLSKGMPIDVVKCKSIIRALKKDTYNSAPFLLPVDAIAQGCPTYYDEIKNPMDFSTLEQNLTQGKYKTMDQFESDMRLIFNNCRQFNPPGMGVYLAADAQETAFDVEWQKATKKKLSSAERTFVIQTLNTMMGDDSGIYFRVPVDPVALGIPHYFDVVDRRDARDLRTIKQNTQAGKYDSFSGIEADIQQMIANAIKFNGEPSLVGDAARKMGRMWHSALSRKKKEDARQQASGSGSAGGHGSSEPPSKKLKLM